MSVLLTINYRTSKAVVSLLFPNAAEARRELLRRAKRMRILGNGSIGSLVSERGDVKASYTIEVVAQ